MRKYEAVLIFIIVVFLAVLMWSVYRNKPVTTQVRYDVLEEDCANPAFTGRGDYVFCFTK